MIADFSPIRITGYILVVISALLPLDLSSQSSNAKLEKEAETAFESGNYRTALKLYRTGGFDHSTNKKALLNIGICLYEINDVDSAVKMFQWLINEGKTEADVFLYMGKSLQAKNNFIDAITYYKKFLEKTNPNNPLVQWAKDELTRCANGARMKFADEAAYVENAGASINTLYSEFGVKNSPTIIEKIYFNSNRADDFGSSEEASNNTDIYSATLINGKWTTPLELPANVNSAAYEEVCGFSADGQIIYYLARVGNEFEIKTDTFSDQEGIVYQGIFHGPYEIDGGGTDLTFFNDTICLFSSNAPGGYGGYDLYIALQHDGIWSKVENLGPTINSFYDERFPFLTRNGQTLFFSSDNLQSMGGYDVFRAVFDPEHLKWSLPQNLSFPVNSSLDDTYLVLAPDGASGYITSNRKTGYGDNDVYMVFFKQPVIAHQQISATPTYYQILIENGKDQMTTDEPDQPVEIKEYFLSHLFLEENGEVLTPQNMKKLDLLANLMLIYPQIVAELSGFDLPTGQSTFNLYFSIKKVEKAVEYLERKGVPKSRLLMKGYGSSFPLVNNSAGIQNNAVFMKLNHRIEIGLHHFENEPVITHLENIPVPENLVDPQGAKFTSLRHGLYYSVQIASVSQILQNTSLDAMSEIFIEVDNGRGNYRYMAGMLPTYEEAEKKLGEMIGLGFTDAFVVPYIDGLRVDQNDISKFSIQYPDLLIYMEKTNK